MIDDLTYRRAQHAEQTIYLMLERDVAESWWARLLYSLRLYLHSLRRP